MKQILALACLAIIIINHFIDYGFAVIEPSNQSLSNETLPSLNLSVSDPEKTVHHIAKLFGEKYQKKNLSDKKPEKKKPKNINLVVQIEGIYKTPENAKVRLNTRTGKKVEPYELSVGDELQGYKLVSIDAKMITFERGKKQFPIEIYKPQSLKVKEKVNKNHEKAN